MGWTRRLRLRVQYTLGRATAIDARGNEQMLGRKEQEKRQI